MVKNQNSFTHIKIDSFDELLKNEKEILRRIDMTHNGGNLFLVHPFMLLSDIDVELSEQVRAEITHYEPHLLTLSAAPYHALKESKEYQTTRFHIHGLFKKGSK